MLELESTNSLDELQLGPWCILAALEIFFSKRFRVAQRHYLRFGAALRVEFLSCTFRVDWSTASSDDTPAVTLHVFADSVKCIRIGEYNIRLLDIEIAVEGCFVPLARFQYPTSLASTLSPSQTHRSSFWNTRFVREATNVSISFIAWSI